jgi:hypothetical protein
VSRVRVGRSATVFALAAAIGAVAVMSPRIVTRLTAGPQPADLSARSRGAPRSPVKLTDTAAQFWLQNGFSNLVLDLPGPAAGAGAQIQQRESEVAPGQHWRVQPLGSHGFMTISNVRTGLVLAIPDRSTVDGAPLVQAKPNGDDTSQQWAMEDAGQGEVWIVNRHSGKVLDLPGHDVDKKDGTGVQQWQRQNNAKDQRWIIVRQ